MSRITHRAHFFINVGLTIMRCSHDIIWYIYMNDEQMQCDAYFSHNNKLFVVFNTFVLTVFSVFLGLLNINVEEKRHRIEVQSRDSKWHQFVEGELILKQGLIDKRKGLFARRRMLLLTTGPRLFYVDPNNMVLKGEIPWSPELSVEVKNFKIFLIHTVSYLITRNTPSQLIIRSCFWRTDSTLDIDYDEALFCYSQTVHITWRIRPGSRWSGSA